MRGRLIIAAALLAGVAACSGDPPERAGTSTTSIPEGETAATNGVAGTTNASTTTTTVPPLDANCTGKTSDATVAITDEATLMDFLGRTSQTAARPFLYAKIYCGPHPDVGDELYVVRPALPEPPTGIVLWDADGDGFFIEGSSQGLEPPLFRSESGKSAVGHSLFTSNYFVYASTTIDTATSVQLSSGGQEERVPLVAPGVADITTPWTALDDDVSSFTVKWLDAEGVVVDQLSDRFLGLLQ